MTPGFAPGRLVTLAAIVSLVALVGACTKGPTGPSSSAPYSQIDLKLGTGTEAATGNTVTLNYTGWLYDPTKADFKGLVFDTSVGGTPLTFALGSNQVIAGFERGVLGMKVGGARRITVPSTLGYGPTRNNSIPPYATLIFDVDLLDVVVPATSGS